MLRPLPASLARNSIFCTLLLALAAVLVGLGVTSLSMSVRAIPRVAQKLGGLTRDDCRRLADAAAGASSPAAAREEARAVLG